MHLAELAQFHFLLDSVNGRVQECIKDTGNGENTTNNRKDVV